MPRFCETAASQLLDGTTSLSARRSDESKLREHGGNLHAPPYHSSRNGLVSQAQTTVPNNFPMPAVRAIASAPQNVTRAVARRIFAPPAFAPMAPRSARKPKDAADTIGTSALAGDTTTMSKGIAAPAEKVAADVSAA
jgi:hypothetical protein